MSRIESLRLPEMGQASRILVTTDDQGNQRVNGLPVIDQRIAYQNGSFFREELIVSGQYDSMGRVIDGLTGKETVISRMHLRPTLIFPVRK